MMLEPSSWNILHSQVSTANIWEVCVRSTKSRWIRSCASFTLVAMSLRWAVSPFWPANTLWLKGCWMILVTLTPRSSKAALSLWSMRWVSWNWARTWPPRLSRNESIRVVWSSTNGFPLKTIRSRTWAKCKLPKAAMWRILSGRIPLLLKHLCPFGCTILPGSEIALSISVKRNIKMSKCIIKSTTLDLLRSSMPMLEWKSKGPLNSILLSAKISTKEKQKFSSFSLTV